MGLVKSSERSSPILVDTSFLVSVYDKREPRNRQCMAVLASVHRPLATCEPVITEAMYHLRRIPKAQQAILESVQQSILEIPFRISDTAREAAELMVKYADTPADFADACLIHMADELDTGDILTLDSDFVHYRWRRNRRFNMLIPLE
jgi:predicted nucleic acid-binding protein